MKKTVVFLTVTFRDGLAVQRAQGTAFLVMVPDKRIGENGGFTYLVTNRHMVDPSVALRRPVQVLGLSIAVNRLLAAEDEGSALTEVALPPLQWQFSTDPSVDLAVAPLGLDRSKVDFLVIPEPIFATKDVVKSRQIAEGDSVMFAGFFAQFPGQKKIEPVIRQGILAMLPDEDMPTTLQLPGKLYLADLHSFHGNSGSPVFVNLGGMRNGAVIVGETYFLIGVLSGYLYESEDLRLDTAATFIGEGHANSGITTIVPVDQLKEILDTPEFVRQREAEAAKLLPQH
ncbi:MAG: hypothetical protein WBH45_07525 [Acidobacteriaceae bacterium]